MPAIIKYLQIFTLINLLYNSRGENLFVGSATYYVVSHVRVSESVSE